MIYCHQANQLINIEFLCHLKKQALPQFTIRANNNSDRTAIALRLGNKVDRGNPLNRKEVPKTCTDKSNLLDGIQIGRLPKYYRIIRSLET